MTKETRSEGGGVARSGADKALGDTSPYQLIPGATEVLGPDGDRQLIASSPAAAHHLQSALFERNCILEVLQGLLVAARTSGVDLAPAVQAQLGPSSDEMVRRHHLSLRGASPANRFWLVMLPFQRVSNDHCLMRWNGRAPELWGRSFTSVALARSICATINWLDRLREAVLLLHGQSIETLPTAVASAVNEATTLVRRCTPPSERYAFDCELRRLAAHHAGPPAGFSNPWLESRGEDITLIRPQIRTLEDGVAAHMLCFAWSEQGSTEFMLQFPGAEERAAAASTIWQHFRIEQGPAVAGGGRGSPMSELRREGLTITPDMLASLVPPTTLVRFTPSSPESRTQMLRLGIDTMGRRQRAVPLFDVVERIEQARQQARGASDGEDAASELLYRDHRFVVTDHGTRGIRIAFRLDGSRGERWFSREAAAEIRAMIEAPDLIEASPRMAALEPQRPLSI